LKDDSIGFLTKIVTQFNKVCHSPHEKFMKCEKMVDARIGKIRECEKNWIHTFMEGSFELVSGRKLTTAHFM
jgi:hypothetical protein